MLGIGADAGCRRPAPAEDERPALPVLEGLAAVPKGARVVIGFDVKALARDPLTGRAVAQLFARDPELERTFRALTGECELDPAENVRRVLLAMGESQDDVLLVASGTFSEARLAACVGKHAGGQLRTRSLAGRTAYQVDRGGESLPVFFAFSGESTVLVSSTARWLEAALTPGESVTDDRDLARLIRLARPDAAIFAAGLVPEAAGAGLLQAAGGELGAAPQGIFGHLRLGEGLEAELGAEMASDEDANALVSLIKSQLAALSLIAQRHGLGRLVGKVEVEPSGRVVSLKVALSPEEVRTLMARIDTGGGDDKDPGPLEDPEGESDDVQGDASPGDEATVR